MRTVIHVAAAENGVIGRQGELPWRLSSDLKRFKAATMGKPVIMGRKTWEGLGRPLPGRLNIVVTRDPTYAAEGADVVRSVEAGLARGRVWAQQAGVDEICVIGGGEIYRQALPLADTLHVTHVLAAPEGDAHFPPVDPMRWRAVATQELPAGERDSEPTRHVVYERIPANSAID